MKIGALDDVLGGGGGRTYAVEGFSYGQIHGSGGLESVLGWQPGELSKSKSTLAGGLILLKSTAEAGWCYNQGG